MRSAAERGGNNYKGFKDFHLRNGSSQGQNIALAVLIVPNSIDSGGEAGLYLRLIDHSTLGLRVIKKMKVGSTWWLAQLHASSYGRKTDLA